MVYEITESGFQEGRPLLSSESTAKPQTRLPALPVLRVLQICSGQTVLPPTLEALFEGLNEQGAISYRFLSEDTTDQERCRQAVEWADAVFFFRGFLPSTLSLLRFSKELGKATFYCTDEDFLLRDDSPEPGQHQAHDFAGAYVSLIREADCVWVYTKEMARRCEALNPKIILGILPGPLELLPDTARVLSRDEEPRIILYSCRFVHNQEASFVVKPLLRILETSPASFKIGCLDTAPSELQDHPRVQSLRPLMSSRHDDSYRAQATGAVGLTLLEDTPFHRSKAPYPYVECASLGIPGIYSDMPVYSSSIKDGITGYLAPSTEEGLTEALDRLLKDGTFRQKVRSEALQDVSCHHSLKAAQLQLLRELSLLAIEKMPAPAKKPSLLVIGYDKASSTHIDALQSCRRLEREGLLDFTWREPGHTTDQNLEEVDGVYVVRAFEPVTLPVLGWAKQREKPLICSWDDNFFRLTSDTALGRFYSRRDIRRAMEKFLRECSLILASTPPLASYSRTLNSDVMEAIYGLTAPDRPHEATSRPDCFPGRVRIGFFGANQGINEPFMIEALRGLRNRYQNRITIEMIGLTPSEELASLIDSYFGMVWDYDEALGLLKSRCWDIGLAPLTDNQFNAAKQATKFRDYAWCGMAIVASDVPAYRRAMRHGLHGLLVDNTAPAWTEAIVSLVEDPEKKQFIAAGAKSLLENVHLQEQTIASWYQLLWRVAKFKESRALPISPQSLSSREATNPPDDEREPSQSLDRNFKACQSKLDRARAEFFNLKEKSEFVLEELERYRERRIIRWTDRFSNRYDFRNNLSPAFHPLFADSKTLKNELSRYRLQPSVNLRSVPFLEYSLRPGRAYLKGVLLAPIVDLPSENGLLGIEISSSSRERIVHSTVPIRALSEFVPTPLEFQPIEDSDQGVFRLKVFARGVDYPIRIFEWRKYSYLGWGPLRTRPFCGLLFERLNDASETLSAQPGPIGD